MGSVQVTEAGRSDQTRATSTVPVSEAFVNENASQSPDQNLAGGRCRSDKKPGNDLCHLHAWKEPVDAEE